MWLSSVFDCVWHVGDDVKASWGAQNSGLCSGRIAFLRPNKIVLGRASWQPGKLRFVKGRSTISTLTLAAQPKKLDPMLAAVSIIFDSEWSDM